MKTIKQAMMGLLAESGMWEKDAQTVMETVIADPGQEHMRSRWDDPADEYPDALMVTTWLVVRAAALAWIDKHKPKAWYRRVLEVQ